MGENESPNKGVLARLPPAWRALAIFTLAALVIGGLIALDPSEFAKNWREERLETLERVLNILVLLGSIWIVLFEGEAILAAFARMFAERLAFNFSALIEVLKKAGHSLPSIQAMIADLRARMWSRRTSTPSAPPEPFRAPQEPEPVLAPRERKAAPMAQRHAPGSDEQARNVRTDEPKSHRWPWLLVGGIGLAVGAVIIANGLRQEPPSPPPPPPPPQVWVRATGSISETLTACMGRRSWEQLEQSVADANTIECSRRAGSLVCPVQGLQPLLLTPQVGECGANTPTFESRDAALASE